MIVYRLCRKKYRNDLSGRGAELAGGRWNSQGTALVYTGDSRALCTAEIAVHTPLGIMPADYWLVLIEIPDHLPAKEVDIKKLPRNWRGFPHPDSTQKIGDAFVTEMEYAVLKVPSAVVEGDFNYLLNPRHSAFSAIRVIESVPFSFDKRLFIR